MEICDNLSLNKDGACGGNEGSHSRMQHGPSQERYVSHPQVSSKRTWSQSIPVARGPELILEFPFDSRLKHILSSYHTRLFRFK